MTNSTPQRINILDEAKALTTGQREQDYGTPQENFQRMADYANIIFAKNFQDGTPISSRNMAELMITVKLSRLANSPTHDTYVDIAGYAALAGELSGVTKKETGTPAVPVFEMRSRTPEEIAETVADIASIQSMIYDGSVGK